MTIDSPDGKDPVTQKLAAYRMKLRDEPNNGTLWLEYGDFVDEEYVLPDEVVRAYENAMKLLPHKDLRLRLGSAHVEAGNPDVGIAMIKDSVSENPRAHGFCFLADAFLRLDDYDSAKQAAEQATSEDPDFEEGYYLLGEAVRHSSREKAVGYFRAAIERDESYALAWQALGRELVADDETINEGIAALEKAIELDPEDGWAMAFLANALWRTDEIVAADKWYRRAMVAFPDCEEMKRWHEQFLDETD